MLYSSRKAKLAPKNGCHSDRLAPATASLQTVKSTTADPHTQYTTCVDQYTRLLKRNWERGALPGRRIVGLPSDTFEPQIDSKLAKKVELGPEMTPNLERVLFCLEPRFSSPLADRWQQLLDVIFALFPRRVEYQSGIQKHRRVGLAHANPGIPLPV